MDKRTGARRQLMLLSGLCVLLLGGCEAETSGPVALRSSAEQAAPPNLANVREVGEIWGCRVYRIDTEGKVLYLASNSGHYGGCALIESKP